jgi:hypothetical protein
MMCEAMKLGGVYMAFVSHRQVAGGDRLIQPH